MRVITFTALQVYRSFRLAQQSKARHSAVHRGMFQGQFFVLQTFTQLESMCRHVTVITTAALPWTSHCSDVRINMQWIAGFLKKRLYSSDVISEDWAVHKSTTTKPSPRQEQLGILPPCLSLELRSRLWTCAASFAQERASSHLRHAMGAPEGGAGCR